MLHKKLKFIVSTMLIVLVSLTSIYEKQTERTLASETYIDYMTPLQKEWDQLLGGTEDDVFRSIVQTSDGGYVAVGSSKSTVSGDINEVNHGADDAVIAKFDADGNPTWNHLFGGRNGDFFESVVQTSDGGFIAVGYSYSSATGGVSDVNNGWADGLIVKYDTFGNYQWDRLYGGNDDDSFSSIVGISNGQFVVAGISMSQSNAEISDVRPGNGDALIMKFDSSGFPIWDQIVGRTEYDGFSSIIQTSDGGFLCVGSTAYNFGGEIKDESIGNSDGLLVKFDAEGQPEWDQVFGGWDHDGFSSVIEDIQGGYVAVGTSSSSQSGEISEANNGENDGLLVKFDEHGNYQWDQLYGGQYNDYFQSLIQTTDGGFIIAGSTEEYNALCEFQGPYSTGNALMVKFDTTGKPVWDNVFGGDGEDHADQLVPTADGFVLVGNTTSSNEGITDDNNGKSDGFLAKYSYLVSKLEVISQPVDLSILREDQAVFQSLVEGSPTATVIWQVSTDNGMNWVDLFYANSTTLSFKAYYEDNGNLYRAKFSNYYMTVYSNPVKLTVGKDRNHSGVYNILSKKSGLALDVFDAGKTEGTNIIQWGYHGMENQQWKFELLTNGYYKITSVLNPEYSLDVYGGGTEVGNKVIQYHYHGGINQQWKVIENYDGSISLMSRLSEENGSNLVLDVYGGGMTEGVNVIQYHRNGADNQKWNLIPYEPSLLSFETNGGNDLGILSVEIGQLVPKSIKVEKEGMLFAGWYRDEELTIPWNLDTDRILNYDIMLYAKWVKDFSGTYTIRSKNSYLVMDVYGGGTTEGTNIIQYSFHGRTNQQWKIESLNNGYYKITSMLNPEYSIDVYGGGTTMGNRVIQYHYHGGINQQWKILENADGSISFMSRLAEESGTGYLLDVYGGGKTEGVNVIQWVSNNGDNQKWYLKNVN